MPSNPAIRNIPRDKLYAILKTPELVQLFEDVLYGVGTSLPAGIDAATGVADAAQATASSAQSNLNLHITDLTDAHDASAISVVPAGGITDTDVQAALVALDTAIAAASSAAASFSRGFMLMGA